jgi:hypothetical protein
LAVLIGILVAGAIIALTAGFIVWQINSDQTQNNSGQIDGIFDSGGAISCDSPICADIGK